MINFEKPSFQDRMLFLNSVRKGVSPQTLLENAIDSKISSISEQLQKEQTEFEIQISELSMMLKERNIKKTLEAQISNIKESISKITEDNHLIQQQVLNMEKSLQIKEAKKQNTISELCAYIKILKSKHSDYSYKGYLYLAGQMICMQQRD